MSAYPDEQLVMEALGDSHLAFEQLIEQYQHGVLRTIASIVSDEQAAQDVAQETFLSAWSNLAELKWVSGKIAQKCTLRDQSIF